jgi:hypothetical protein
MTYKTNRQPAPHRIAETSLARIHFRKRMQTRLSAFLLADGQTSVHAEAAADPKPSIHLIQYAGQRRQTEV